MFHRLSKLELQVYPASLLFNTQHIDSQEKQHYWKKKRVLRPQFSRVSLHVLGVSYYSAFSCEDLWGSELVNRCKITTDTKILGTFYQESPKVHELLIEQLTDKTINPKSFTLVVGFTQNLSTTPPLSTRGLAVTKLSKLQLTGPDIINMKLLLAMGKLYPSNK